MVVVVQNVEPVLVGVGVYQQPAGQDAAAGAGVAPQDASQGMLLPVEGVDGLALVSGQTEMELGGRRKGWFLPDEGVDGLAHHVLKDAKDVVRVLPRPQPRDALLLQVLGRKRLKTLFL